MEPPAHPADPGSPEDAADPGDPAEARAKQPGKWALLRSLNQALKTYAVLPVRPGSGGGGRAPRTQSWASVSPPVWSQAGRRVAKPQGARTPEPSGAARP